MHTHWYRLHTDPEYIFPLVLTNQQEITEEGGLFSDSITFTQYSFKLPEEAIQNIKDVQSLLDPAETGIISFGVGMEFDETQSPSDVVTFSVHIKLYEDDDFVTLFDRVEMKLNVNKTRSD